MHLALLTTPGQGSDYAGDTTGLGSQQKGQCLGLCILPPLPHGLSERRRCPHSRGRGTLHSATSCPLKRDSADCPVDGCGGSGLAERSEVAALPHRAPSSFLGFGFSGYPGSPPAQVVTWLGRGSICLECCVSEPWVTHGHW